jgi:hypothetical protein
MNLKCAIGMHEWSGCKCSTCGKTRDDDHDWSKDCDKCAKCGRERAGVHSWSGCKCSTCGKTSDESHDWSKNCDKCAKCGKERANAHSWSGCQCSTCGRTRDEDHDLSKDCDKCAKCGKERIRAHSWSGCKCSMCGRTRDEAHDWSMDRAKCARCGKVPSIHDAARAGDLDVVRRLLEQDASLSRAERNGSTPLHYAAEKGSISIAELLIEKGADITAKNASRETPLHYAAGADHIDMVEFLIGRGADVNAGYPRSKTPLHTAVSILGGPEVVKKLLSRGAIIDAQDNLEYTPLHWAVDHRKSSIVRLLCEHGADKSKRTFRGETAERMASGHQDIEEALRAPVIRKQEHVKSWLAGHVVDWFFYSHHAQYGDMIQRPADFFEYICNQLRIEPSDLGGVPQSRYEAENRTRHLAEGSVTSVARRFFAAHLHKADDIAVFAFPCSCVFRAPGALVVLVKSASIRDVGTFGERINLTDTSC